MARHGTSIRYGAFSAAFSNLEPTVRGTVLPSESRLRCFCWPGWTCRRRRWLRWWRIVVVHFFRFRCSVVSFSPCPSVRPLAHRNTMRSLPLPLLAFLLVFTLCIFVSPCTTRAENKNDDTTQPPMNNIAPLSSSPELEKQTRRMRKLTENERNERIERKQQAAASEKPGNLSHHILSHRMAVHSFLR